MANEVRADAIAIYSRAWDERARRDLEALLRRNAAELPGERAVGRGFRRRTAPNRLTPARPAGPHARQRRLEACQTRRSVT